MANDDQAAVIERAMTAVAATDTPETRRGLFRAVLAGYLLVMTPDAPEMPTAWAAQPGESFQLVTVASDDGHILPAFTRQERILDWRPQGGGFVAIPARGLFEMAEAADVARVYVNPGSRPQGIITRPEVEALARGRLPLGRVEEVAARTPVYIGRPAAPPSAEVQAVIHRALSAQPLVLAGWLFVQVQANQAPELCVGVVLQAADEPTQRSVMLSIVDSLAALGRQAHEVLLMVADPSLQASLASGRGDLIFDRRTD